MRILFGTDNFYPNVNGSANFIYELAKGLVKNGHDIFVIAPSRKFKYTVNKHNGMIVYGIQSVMIPKIIHPSGIRVPLTISPTRIKGIVEKIRPDIIHIQDHFMIGSKVATAGRGLRISLVGTNHFMPENFMHYLHPPDFAKEPLSKLAWRQFINVYKHLDCITAPTKTAINLLKNLGLKNPMLTISCGVDLNRFNPSKNGNYLKKVYKLSNSKPIVLFVGRLDKEKNIDELLQGFAIVLESIDAYLLIAGRGAEKSNLVNLVKRLGIGQNVIFTGFIPDKDLPFLYRIADCFVIASYAELQSIATMEAMACGLSIVAAKVMALPELVHDGENGYLFNQGSVDTLAKHVIKILKDPSLKKNMSRNSLKIISKHNLNNTIKKYEDLYKLVCEKSFSKI